MGHHSQRRLCSDDWLGVGHPCRVLRRVGLGDRLLQVLHSETYSRRFAFSAWSPDGRTILFAVGTPLNLFRKAAAGGGDEQRLTKSSHPQYPNDWSRDGRFLLYTELRARTGSDLWILPVPPEGKVAPDAKPRRYLYTQFNVWKQHQVGKSPTINPG